MTRLATLLVAGALSLSLGAIPAHAQVATSAAADFVGEWSLAFQGEMPITARLVVTDQDGQLSASVTIMENTDRVRTITSRESAVAFAYETSYNGQAVPIVITLSPTDQGMRAVLDAMGGAFTMTGTATKG